MGTDVWHLGTVAELHFNIPVVVKKEFISVKTCKYCGEQFSNRGLPLHIYRAHKKQVEAKRQFEEQGRQIDAQVHAMVEAKKREFAFHDEIQKLADDIENSYKPLMTCNVCGGTWDNHADSCPFKQKTSSFDQFIDFMIAILGGGQQ
jgi:hypothetical protein